MEKPEDRPFDVLVRELQAEPDGYATNKNMGLHLAKKRNFLIQAEPHLRKALSYDIKDRDRMKMLAWLADVHEMKGEIEDAFNIFAYLTGEHGSAEFIARCGELRCRMGDIQGASSIFRQLVGLCFDNAKVVSAESRSPVFQVIADSAAIRRHFGELASRPDAFLKARALGYVHPSELVLIAPEDDVSNASLLDYWRDLLTVVSDPADIEHFRQKANDHKVFFAYIPMPNGLTLPRDYAYRMIQRKWEDQGRAPLLSLRAEHRARGREWLNGLGMADDDWFVCLHVRSAGFYDEEMPWHHNQFRNAPMENYFPAVEAITEGGGWVVRIGDPSMPPLPAMERVIDYAHAEDREDWKDIFLMAENRFMVCMGSGPAGIALAFGAPLVGTDWFPLGSWPLSQNDLFIHKLLRSKRDGRILSIGEALRTPLFAAQEPVIYDTLGLEPVENGPEDILDAVTEMLERLDGGPGYSGADDRLQDAYRAEADPYGLGISARLAKGFLHRHPELIGDTAAPSS